MLVANAKTSQKPLRIYIVRKEKHNPLCDMNMNMNMNMALRHTLCKFNKNCQCYFKYSETNLDREKYLYSLLFCIQRFLFNFTL